MDHQEPDKDQQIAAFLTGNSSEAEMEDLQYWQNQSAENKNIFEDSLKVWENCPAPLTQSSIEQDKIAVKGQIIIQDALQLHRDHVLLKFLRIAAILIGPVMLAIGWYIGSHNQSSKTMTWNTVTAPRKHIAVCTISDGTEVWLNAGSTLSYPSTGSENKREVKLTGEGYFMVTKDAKKPFFVITPQATVKVLGTTFNMKAFPGEEHITTTLEEGSIEFYTAKTGETPFRLRPGEQAIYHISEGKVTIDQVDPSRYSAWRSEKFLFRDADLITIIAELERLFDIKIHVKNPQLEKLRFRGMFSYDQDLLDAFETLRRSVKLSYTIKDREVWLE